LNIMRCLAGLEWGADFTSLKYIYIALIRSRIDYGSVGYGSAAKSVLSQLDIIQARALRTCLGAIKTAPICSLQVEAGEMPLWLRRKQLIANYWVNLKGHRDEHPAKRVLEMCWEKGKEEKMSFGWVSEGLAEQLKIQHMEFSPTVLWTTIPKLMFQEKKNVDLNMWNIK